MLNVSVTESAPVNIEIVPQNVSKGVVFDRLESIYNLKKPLRIAIGDSLNDLSMFESADISFAMGNSHQEIMKKLIMSLFQMIKTEYLKHLKEFLPYKLIKVV